MKKTALRAAVVTALSLAVYLPYADARGGGHGGHGGWNPGNNNGPGSTTQKDRGSLLQNVDKGQLSANEVEGLQKEQEALKKASDAITGDAKMTKEENDTFEDDFDAASFYIWSKGADDDGKAQSRYGTRVFPIDELAKRLDADNLTKAQAKKLYDALRSLVTAKLKLNEELAPEARASLQRQFNESLAKYYMLK